MNSTNNPPSFIKEKPIQLKFGTSGIRGLVTDMSDLECYINIKGFIQYLLEIGDIQRSDPISIAGDFRSSSERIMVAVATAIEDSRCKVDNCGYIPTPALAYYAMQKSQASIMVTGSHIPDNRNGIKPYKKHGEVCKTDEAEILDRVTKIRIQEYTKKVDDTIFNKMGMFKKVRSLGFINKDAEVSYVQRYLNAFPPNCLSSKTIVLYEHSAVGRDMLAQVLRGLGAEVIPVARSDRFVAIDTENLTIYDRKLFRQLADEYRPRDVCAIVSIDGDSDRPLIVDEQGEFHRGDEIGIVVSQYVNADFAAVPISSNDAVAIQLEKDGIAFTNTRIGSPYVIAAMNEAITKGRHSVVGWEVNGGFLTGTDLAINGKTIKALPTRDAFLPIICVILQAIKKGLSVSELLAELPRRYSQAGLIDHFPVDTSQMIIERFSPLQGDHIIQVDFADDGIKVTDKAGRTSLLDSHYPVARAMLEKRKVLKRYFNSGLGFDDIICINYIDGIRITFTKGDVSHIRPSGNAPQLRFYSNANSQERADKIVQFAVAEPDGILRRLEGELSTENQ